MARNRILSYANVMASVAVFIALSGTGYAAATLTKDSVRTEQIKNGSIKAADLGAHSVTGDKVKDGSLLAKDFKFGELPGGGKGEKGDPGLKGDKGDKGEKGEPGIVDTSRFFTKTDSDARFLGKTGKATDADMLDGLDAGEFARGRGRIVSASNTVLEDGQLRQIADLGTFRLSLRCADGSPDAITIGSSRPFVAYTDDGSGTPRRDPSLTEVTVSLSTMIDRLTIQAVVPLDTSLAMTASVTVADVGNACEYLVHATTSG